MGTPLLVSLDGAHAAHARRLRGVRRRFDDARNRWLVLSNEFRARITAAVDDGRGWIQSPPEPHPTAACTSSSIMPISPRRRVALRLTTPPELYLLDVVNAKLDGPFTQSTTKIFRSFPWLAPETSRSRPRRRRRVLAPAPIRRAGATSNGAGVIFIHGAGYLQNVIDGWSYYYREYMFNCFLAHMGTRCSPSPGLGGLRPRLPHRNLAHGRARPRRHRRWRTLPGARARNRREENRAYGGSYGGFPTLMDCSSIRMRSRAGMRCAP